MRVVVAEVNGSLWSPGSFTRHSCFEPLGAEYVGGAAAAEGHAVSVLQQRSDSEEGFASRIVALAPEVLGLSSMTYAFPAATRIAKRVRHALPDAFVVLGGYHVTARPESVDGDTFHAGVVGPGERPFAGLLRSIDAHTWPEQIPGVAYRDERNQLIVCPRGPWKIASGEWPRPFRDAALVASCRVSSFIYPAPAQQIAVAQVSASRGCPFACAFCSSSEFWGKLVDYRSSADVVAEIRHLRDTYGTNLVFFSDLTFNASARHALDLCQALQRADLGVSWFAMCRPDRMTVDVAQAMRAAGCTKVSFGLDSIDPSILRRLKPGQERLAIDRLANIFQVTWDTGLITRAYAIIGHPEDTLPRLMHFAGALSKLALDDIRISFLTPFPGTPLYDEYVARDLLDTTDWERFSSDEPVVKVPGLPPAHLLNSRSQMFATFYGSHQYEERIREKLSRFPTLRDAWLAHAVFIRRLLPTDGATPAERLLPPN